MTRASPEDALQTAVVRLLMLQRIEGLAWTAVNPKPFKTRSTAAKSKTLGMKAGWPDLQFIYCGTPFGIEIKAPKAPGQRAGKPSDVQLGMHQYLGNAGCKVFLAWSVDDVLKALAEMGVPVNARMM